MKNGDKIKCPHCGEKSFVKEKKEFDDNFTLKSTSFRCALCGGKIDPAPETSTSQKNSSAADKFAALLGEERAAKVSFAPQEDDGKVCLHCRYYIKHPFMDRCGLHMKEINVMESCSDFAKKENE